MMSSNKKSIPPAEQKSIIAKYKDPKFPTSLGGVHAFSKRLGKPVERVRDVLSGVEGYVRHVPVRRHYPRGRVFVSGPFSQFHTDLISMEEFNKENRGYKYIFVLIDAFSKRCWLVPLKDKSSGSTARAFHKIVREELPFAPYSVYSDQGSEYKKEFSQLLKQLDVKQYMSKDKDIKSSIAERVIRTIKGKIFKYFTLENTREYISVLDLICDNYNNSYNSAIGMTPNEVGFHNVKRVFDNLYMGRGRYGKIQFDEHHVKSKFKFDVGDHVRLTKSKSVFDKAYQPNVSIEVFKIARRIPRTPVVYRLVDLQDDEIMGTFYEQELVRSKRPSSKDLHTIDKILRRRTGKNGVREVLVSYLGWPKSFNAWIKESSIITPATAAAVTDKKRRRKWKRHY